jgi:hypothetical protein
MMGSTNPVAEFLLQSVIILPCFGGAFALSVLIDRLVRHKMPHLVRGLFTFIVGLGILVVVAVPLGIVLWIITCRFSTCDFP